MCYGRVELQQFKYNKNQIFKCESITIEKLEAKGGVNHSPLDLNLNRKVDCPPKCICIWNYYSSKFEKSIDMEGYSFSISFKLTDLSFKYLSKKLLINDLCSSIASLSPSVTYFKSVKLS